MRSSSETRTRTSATSPSRRPPPRPPPRAPEMRFPNTARASILNRGSTPHEDPSDALVLMGKGGGGGGGPSLLWTIRRGRGARSRSAGCLLAGGFRDTRPRTWWRGKSTEREDERGAMLTRWRPGGVTRVARSAPNNNCSKIHRWSRRRGGLVRRARGSLGASWEAAALSLCLLGGYGWCFSCRGRRRCSSRCWRTRPRSGMCRDYAS